MVASTARQGSPWTKGKVLHTALSNIYFSILLIKQEIVLIKLMKLIGVLLIALGKGLFGFATKMGI